MATVTDVGLLSCGEDCCAVCVRFPRAEDKGRRLAERFIFAWCSINNYCLFTSLGAIF